MDVPLSGLTVRNSFLLERGSTLGCLRRAGLPPELRRMKGASGANGKDMRLPQALPELYHPCSALSGLISERRVD